VAPLLHASDLHLLYNLGSFLWKGKQMEVRPVYWMRYTIAEHFHCDCLSHCSATVCLQAASRSPTKYIAQLAVLLVLSQAFSVALAIGAAEYFDFPSWLHECSIGFSGELIKRAVIVFRALHTRHLDHLFACRCSVCNENHTYRKRSGQHIFLRIPCADTLRRLGGARAYPGLLGDNTT
jgi:hypothetical protein